jgi:hypothetical protein
VRAQGDLPAALRSYQTSLEIVERLAKSDPGNAGWSENLKVSYAKLADIDEKLHAIPEARAALTAGRNVLVKLIADHPDNTQWKNDLAWFDAEITQLGL